MRKLLVILFVFTVSIGYGQEVVAPIAGNPSLYGKYPKQHQNRSSHNLDSTFVYSSTPLSITDVWDDFSVDKFVQYPPAFTAPNVTDQWYWHLMDAGNTTPEPDTAIYCDSTKARHDTIVVVAGIPTTFTTNFTPHSIWVNDLTNAPIAGAVQNNLYDECYILVDSIIDMVPDPDQDTIWFTNDPTYAQDSIHLFFANLNNPDQIWLDNSACHNYEFPIDPWSLGVATFDGVDSTGMPYQFGGGNAYGEADVLTSKPVNMFGTADVFLQFLYQAGGHGNVPDAQDSLVVDFFLVDSNAWYPMWNNYDVGPIVQNQWDTAFIAVPPNFLDNGFQFRFRNYASLSGALDHWHIDYVQLYENPLYAVQNFADLAVSYPINTLLKDYTSVPWDHYLNLADPNTEMQDTSYLQVWNSDVDATNVGTDMFMEVAYNGTVQNTYNLPNPGGIPPWTSNWELQMNDFPFFTASLHPFFDAPGNDTMATFNVKINANAAVAASNVYEVNDTTYLEQVFKNYYAYDDGSAEVAYGIQGSNSKLAIEFNAYEPDTLVGILMHFVPSVNDVSGNILLLTVWEDDNGQPGDILYQDDFFNPHYPEYGGAKNEFKLYEFLNTDYPSKIAVPQKYYVGWEQIDGESLNIGMDRNTVNNDKIQYNVGGTWIGSTQLGSVMIRPLYSTNIDHTLELQEERRLPIVERDIQMYPNPTNNWVYFNGMEAGDQINIFDMSGRKLIQTTASQIDVSDLTAGMYIIQIRDQNGVQYFSEKLMKQ